jgi:hypothetical protein
MLANGSAFGPEWIAEVLATVIGIALGAIVPVWLFLLGQNNERRKQAEERRRARDEELAERRRQHSLFLAEREEQLAKECASLIQRCLDEWLRTQREARFALVRSGTGTSARTAEQRDAGRDVLRAWIVDSIDAPGVEHLDSARARLLAMGESGNDVRARVDRLNEDLNWNWLGLEVDLLLDDEPSSIPGGIDAIKASYPEDAEGTASPDEYPVPLGVDQAPNSAPNAVDLWRRILSSVGPQYRELESIVAELMTFTSPARLRTANAL